MTGMEMLCGGLGCFVVAAATGEFADFHTDELTAHAWLAIGFLVSAGSIVAYTGAGDSTFRNAEPGPRHHLRVRQSGGCRDPRLGHPE